MEGMGKSIHRPRLFIGSSSEGSAIAEAIQTNLEPEIETTTWKQGVLGLSEGTLEGLDRASRKFDFAVIVLTPDDFTVRRGQARNAPRDNVILEVGFFVGRLGRYRTFIVLPQDQPIHLPTDLAGVTIANYLLRSDDNLQAALGPACTQVKRQIARLGGSPSHSAQPAEGRSDLRPIVQRRRRRRSLGTAYSVGPRASMRIVDISVTGALLETEGELPIGQVLDLDLEIENGRSVHAMGKVVRVQRPDWGKVGGVGVKFTDLAGRSKETIAEYIEADETAS